jgi:hypothetical protein
LDFQKPSTELNQTEAKALIRAFFLGVKVQIIANENKYTKKYNLRIQLSSTLFVDCGDLIDECDELTPEDICNQVSMDLYNKSSDFFDASQDGVTVWRVRVAQELFGELKPEPEVFWPPEAEMAARRALMRDPLSAMPPAVANSNPTPAASPVRASAPDLLDAPRSPTRARQAFFPSGVAALLLVGLTGLMFGYACWGAFSASPSAQVTSARTASAGFSPQKDSGSIAPLGHALSLAALTPITPVRFDDASEVFQELPCANRPVDETAPALSTDFAAPPKTSESVSVAEARPGKKAESLKKKKFVALKTVASRAGQGGRSLHGGARKPADPLAIVGRAVKSFTARIALDLRRIPLRLSSLMAGR